MKYKPRTEELTCEDCGKKRTVQVSGMKKAKRCRACFSKSTKFNAGPRTWRSAGRGDRGSQL